MALATLKTALEGIKKFRQDAAAQLHDLESKREALRRQQDEINTLPPPRETAIARMDAQIDRWAAQYDQAAANWIRTSTISRAEPPGPSAIFNPLGLSLDFDNQGSTQPDKLTSDPTRLTPFATVGALAPMLKERLRGIIEGMEWPERVGPPDAERAKQAQATAQKIAALDVEISAVLEQAREAGVDL